MINMVEPRLPGTTLAEFSRKQLKLWKHYTLKNKDYLLALMVAWKTLNVHAAFSFHKRFGIMKKKVIYINTMFKWCSFEVLFTKRLYGELINVQCRKNQRINKFLLVIHTFCTNKTPKIHESYTEEMKKRKESKTRLASFRIDFLHSWEQHLFATSSECTQSQFKPGKPFEARLTAILHTL